MSSSVSAERLKQLSGLVGTGNGFWSFKTRSKKTGPLTDKTSGQYITYMTKGQYDPRYVKGYDSKVLVALREAWVHRDEIANPGRVLLQEFRDYLYSQQDPSIYMTRLNEDGEEYEVIDPRAGKFIAVYARKWAFNKFDSVWSVQTAKIAKQTFLTFCMDMGVDIPPDVKVW